MLVDDDRTSNFLNKKILNNVFPETEILDFISSEQALAYLKSGNTVDIVLLDINMPEIDGWQFIETTRAENINNYKSIVLLTSSIDESDMEKARTYKEIKGFISKPLKIDVFKKYLNSIGK